MLFQPLSQLQGAAGMGLHAQFQGFQTLEKDPGIERTHGRAGGAQHPEHLFTNLFCIPHYRTADAAALTIQVFSGGMDYDIRPARQRTLQRRGTKAIVHHQQSVVVMGQIGQQSDIGHLGQRIGRGFEKQQTGLRTQGLLPGTDIAQWHETGVDSEPAQILGE